MRKALALVLGVVLGVSVSTAQPVQVTDVSPDDGFDRSLVGGEEFEFSAEVENELDRTVPVGARVVVESDVNMSKKGAELTPTGIFEPGDSESSLENSYRRLDSSTGIYTLTADGAELGDGESGNLELNVTTSPRIEPGQYSFELSVVSIAGEPSDTDNIESVAPGESESVSVDSSASEASVSVTPEEETSVNVTGYDTLSVEPPSDNSEFVGGVEVEPEEEAGAEGEVSIEYSQQFVDDNDIDESSISVQFYNETSGVWEVEEDSEVDTVDNVVSAQVDHFSLYSAFGEQEQDDSPSSDSGDGSEDSGPIDIPDNQEDETESTDSADETQEEAEGQENSQEQTGDDQGASEDTETGGTQQEQTEEEGADDQTDSTQGPTGSFTSSPGGIAALLVLVLVAAVAALERRGRIDLVDSVLNRIGKV
jgi:hypothetical protein|nr:MAG: hypothetical protein J07AB56_05100 [Candidatus Nanosalinarum sp. J07AB56]